MFTPHTALIAICCLLRVHARSVSRLQGKLTTHSAHLENQDIAPRTLGGPNLQQMQANTRETVSESSAGNVGTRSKHMQRVLWQYLVYTDLHQDREYRPNKPTYLAHSTARII